MLILRRISRLQLNNAARMMASTSARLETKSRKMNGWQIHSYGGFDDLELSQSIRIPMITKPTELLIKIDTSSVNPLDVAMAGGYGATLLNALRCKEIEFPLTLGRDFCGTIVHKGVGISREYNIGDKVIGVIPVHQQGCHAEYAVMKSCYVTKKPPNLDDVAAGSLLYTGLTAWAGLYTAGLLGGIPQIFSRGSLNRNRQNKILVLGGSGGVGHLIIQILKAENYTVLSTCSTDAVQMLEALGVDQVIDYKAENSVSNLIESGPYDVIFDCAGKGPDHANEIAWKFANYITFTSPLLKNFDTNGLAGGFLLNTQQIIESNLRTLSAQRGLVKWAFFIPALEGIEYLSRLAVDEKIKPTVQQTFGFEQMKEAYKMMADGHLRGKIAIKY